MRTFENRILNIYNRPASSYFSKVAEVSASCLCASTFDFMFRIIRTFQSRILNRYNRPVTSHFLKSRWGACLVTVCLKFRLQVQTIANVSKSRILNGYNRLLNSHLLKSRWDVCLVRVCLKLRLPDQPNAGITKAETAQIKQTGKQAFTLRLLRCVPVHDSKIKK